MSIKCLTELTDSEILHKMLDRIQTSKTNDISLADLCQKECNIHGTMTLEEYKAQPFKYDGECKPGPISEIWPDLSRHDRREIERLVKKGKNPKITDYI